MRRTDIIEGVQQVYTAITASEMRESLQLLLSSRSKREPREVDMLTEKVLSSLKQYTLFANNFNTAARTILTIFALTELDLL